ncbi:MAG: hypothetical protein IIC82_09130 [Chloroflexi bacterium]|nr:hypothetical protein [Chloroflexota bacterium]
MRRQLTTAFETTQEFLRRYPLVGAGVVGLGLVGLITWFLLAYVDPQNASERRGVLVLSVAGGVVAAAGFTSGRFFRRYPLAGWGVVGLGLVGLVTWFLIAYVDPQNASERRGVAVLVLSVAGGLVAAAGVYAAWRQLVSVNRTIRLSAFSQIIEEFQSKELGCDRRTVYISSFEDPGRISPELLFAARRVMVSFTKIGFLVDQAFIPLDAASVQIFGPPAIKAWEKLKGLAEFERKRRGEPSYARFFEDLAVRCRPKLPEYEPKYFDDPEPETPTEPN